MNELKLTASTNNSDTVVVFLPGASGKAHSDRFAWVEEVAIGVGYACTRVSIWDSTEELNSMTLSDIHLQLDAVLEELSQQFESFIVIGKSFGGGVWLTYSHPKICKQILWAPAFRFSEGCSIEAVQKTKLGELQLTDICISKTDISPVPTTIVHGTSDDVVSIYNSQAIVDAVNGKLITIEGADHSFKEGVHEQELMTATKQEIV